MQNSTLIDFDKNSWCILSPIEQSIKRKIEAVGVPLKDWNISINYGIKTGCNEAFIIDGATKDALIAQDPKSAEIIRPILRGRDIKRYSYEFADKWLIATFPSRHYNIDDYPAVKNYLLSFGKEKLEQSGKKDIGGIKGNNARKKTNNKWFETQDTIAYWDDFSKQKIVWAETIKIYFKGDRNYPRFAFIGDSIYLDKTTFFMPVSPNMLYIIGILNSKLFEYLFDNSYSNILGIGSRGFQKNLFELLPIVKRDNINNNKIVKIEAILSDYFSKGFLSTVNQRNLDDIVFELYQLTKEEICFIYDATDIRRFSNNL